MDFKMKVKGQTDLEVVKRVKTSTLRPIPLSLMISQTPTDNMSLLHRLDFTYINPMLLLYILLNINGSVFCCDLIEVALYILFYLCINVTKALCVLKSDLFIFNQAARIDFSSVCLWNPGIKCMSTPNNTSIHLHFSLVETWAFAAVNSRWQFSVTGNILQHSLEIAAIVFVLLMFCKRHRITVWLCEDVNGC